MKPIIGMEGYYTPGSRFDRAPFDFGDNLLDEEGDGGNNRGKAAYTHMTLLARTTEGMHNLFRISSLASLEGQYRKPRFDRDLLERYGKGLIATTGCPSGEVNMWLRAGKEDRARQAAADFQDIFGKENFYAEVMDHGLSIEKKTQPALLAIAKDLGIPLLGTNDLHYTHKEDAQAHDALLCIQTGSRLNETNRFRFNGDGYYLKSAAEMRALFADLPEACDNTLLVAEQCEVTFTEGADLMPRFPLPEGEDETSWFVKEVERGLHKRWPSGIPDHVRKQADYEVGIICQMGFPGYFLVVADFINWAKDQGIRVGPGRGSAAGSLAAYAMGITDLDPLAHGLIFERFLNPERVSMPDVDIDFDDRRRGEVIRYVSEKYGEERVSQIVTYGTIKAKAAIKDAARVLDRPYSVGDELTKLMPPGVMGKDIPLSGIFDPAHERYKEASEFRARYESDPGAAEVVDQARKLEGLKRQWGVHAAGVIIGRYPLIDSVPIMRRESDGAVITQFDYPTCETLGLLKMDFLGLRNLTVIDDALRNIVINGKDADRPRRAQQGPHRPGHLRPAGPRRHPRRLPVRRRPDAVAAAAHAAGQLRGHLRRRRALPAGPDGRELAHQLRAAQERPAGDHADPPGAGRAAGGDPRPDLRPDRLPGAGHGDRAEGRRVLPRQGRPAAPRDGQEEEVGPGRRVRRLRGRHEGQRLLRRGGQDALGHPGPVRRLRLQQGALGGVRADLLLDGVPQGQLPGRVHGRAAHQRRRRQGQAAGLPGRVPPDGHQGAAARRQRVLRGLHRRRHRHPLRPGLGAQRRAQRRRRDRPGPRGEGRVQGLRRLPAQDRRGGLQQEGHRVALQGRRVRLPRPLAAGPRRRPRATPSTWR